jgi:hypothetical protein
MADRLYRETLVPALQRLDRLLLLGADAAKAEYGPDAATDRFRGLYIGQAEVERLFARNPGAPALQHAGLDQAPLLDVVDEAYPIAALAHQFELTPFDLDLFLIALAPELDLRYERIYAYLQDDVSRKRPSVDLALNLLCSSAEEKLHGRARFGAGAPLLRHDVIHLVADSGRTEPPLLAHSIKPDEQLVRFVLGERGLDRRLATFCRWIEPIGDAHFQYGGNAVVPELLPAVRRARAAGQPLRFYLEGPAGTGRREAAIGLAGAIGTPLLVADLTRANTTASEFERHLHLMFREARLQDAVLYLEDASRVEGAEGERLHEALHRALAAHEGIVIVSGSRPWHPSGRAPLGVVQVPFRHASHDQSVALWRAALADAQLALDRAEINALAGRFRLTAGQIADASATARVRARIGTGPSHRDLVYAAARAQCGHDLAALARKIEPTFAWEDIVLPEDTLAQLREICRRVAGRHHVLGTWGFGRRLSYGKGTTALFTGPSGTGKTMAVEVLARALDLDVYRIDLSGVVSKYIGETEKNLDRVFRAAESANAVLFFDEADALFGKRSEVHDAHDRYANIEISYLLQKMEEYEGLAVLATNLRQNLDDAFTRRLAFTVFFPFPDEAARGRIWRAVWPKEAPLAEDVDLPLLAARFKLSGGNIKNVSLAAAFLAAGESGAITMAHLLRAIRREFQKMGKILADADLNGRHEEGPAPADRYA